MSKIDEKYQKTSISVCYQKITKMIAMNFCNEKLLILVKFFRKKSIRSKSMAENRKYEEKKILIRHRIVIIFSFDHVIDHDIKNEFILFNFRCRLFFIPKTHI